MKHEIRASIAATMRIVSFLATLISQRRIHSSVNKPNIAIHSILRADQHKVRSRVALADMSFWTGAAHQPRSFFYLDKETLSLHVFRTMNCRAMLCPYIRLHHCVAGQTRIPYVAGSYQWNIVSFEEEER